MTSRWLDFERDIVWEPELRLEWSREFLDGSSFEGGFRGVAAPGFQLEKALRDDSVLVASARILARFGPRASASLSFDMESGSDSFTSHTVRLSLSIDL